MRLYHYTGPHAATGKALLIQPSDYYRVADSDDSQIARTLTEAEAIHIVAKQNRLALASFIEERKEWKYDPTTLASGHVGPGNTEQ